MLDFISNRIWFLRAGVVYVVLAILAVAVFGLKPGLEFTGGSAMTLVLQKPVGEADLRQEMTAMGYAEAVIQGTHKGGYIVNGSIPADKIPDIVGALQTKFGSRTVLGFEQEGNSGLTLVFSTTPDSASVLSTIKPLVQGDVSLTPIPDPGYPAFVVRTRALKEEAGQGVGGATLPSELEQLQTDLKQKFGTLTMFDFSAVSSSVASGTVRDAIIAVVVASIGILLYVSFAFRHMPKDSEGRPTAFRYGSCAVIALVHDVFFVLGVFAVLGKFAGIEVNAMFIAAMLTVVGFSVHDTIVVFDRIRENVRKQAKVEFATVVNNSIVETLARSMNTTLTVLIVITALLFIGGSTIRPFLLALFIGLVVGTYSSIFIASQLLILWDKKEWRRFIPGLSHPGA